MRELKKQFSMRWDEVIAFIGIGAGAFLFGQILLKIAVYFEWDDNPEVFPLGTLLAVIVTVAIFLFVGVSSMTICFNQGIGMCSTRRRLIPAFLGFTYLEFLVQAGIVYLLYRLELGIFKVVYAGLKNDLDMGIIFRWKYILTAGLVAAAVNMFFGMLFLKFGKVAWIVMWVLWVGSWCIVPNMTRLLHSHQGTAFAKGLYAILNVFREITEKSILTALVVVSILLIVIAYLGLCKQQVQ